MNSYTYNDTDRILTIYDEDGGIVGTRPYTEMENDDADARLSHSAQMTSVEERLTRIEAKLWPADPEPTTPADTSGIPEFNEIWGNGKLIIEKGVVYRNVSGVPLTSPPSRFPGGPQRWSHLFTIVTDPEPVAPPEATIAEWHKNTSFKIGDKTIRNGRIYRAKVAHGRAHQGTWGPPAAGVWDDLGPA